MSLPVIEDKLVLPLMESLSACLCAELERSPGGTPCFCGLVPGAVVIMDFCDCDNSGCGQAWVRLDQTWPSRSFPQPSATSTSCADPTAVRLQLGVTRCWPGLSEDGEPPDEAQQLEAVRLQMGDLAAMRRAVECCGTKRRRDYFLGAYTAIGPQGNCGGGTLLVTYRVV